MVALPFVTFGFTGISMRSLFLGVALAALALPALAQQNPATQQTRYDVKEINFDLWCQQTQNLPPDRCDKRTPEDEANYETYRAAIEKYEIPYLQRKKDDQNLNQVFIHDDPVPSEKAPSHPADRQIASPKPEP
jgi:hypothetical protein